MMTAKPFTKWGGGKTYLLSEILKRLPAKISTYHEPFLGGGAVFFALAGEKRFREARLNDINEELIRSYAAIKYQVPAVIGELKKHYHDEAYFYAVRAQDWRAMTAPKVAARFIFLNRTCFNGLYRVNKKGGFNVPFGKYANPTICNEENLRACAAALAGTDLEWEPFDRALNRVKSGHTAYIDPPYHPASPTANFTAYDKSGFGTEEQRLLCEQAKKLVERGAHVLLSNSDTPFTRELYRDFHIETVQAPRRINSNAAARGNVNELLISGR